MQGRVLDRRHRGGRISGYDYRHKGKEEGKFEFGLKWEVERRIGGPVGDGTSGQRTNRSSPWGATEGVWGCVWGLSHKKRGPGFFILRWSSRTSVTYQGNPSPIHLLFLGLAGVRP